MPPQEGENHTQGRREVWRKKTENVNRGGWPTNTLHGGRRVTAWVKLFWLRGVRLSFLRLVLFGSTCERLLVRLRVLTRSISIFLSSAPLPQKVSKCQVCSKSMPGWTATHARRMPPLWTSTQQHLGTEKGCGRPRQRCPKHFCSNCAGNRTPELCQASSTTRTSCQSIASSGRTEGSNSGLHRKRFSRGDGDKRRASLHLVLGWHDPEVPCGENASGRSSCSSHEAHERAEQGDDPGKVHVGETLQGRPRLPLTHLQGERQHSQGPLKTIAREH